MSTQPPEGQKPDPIITQGFQHSHIGARVPEKVAKGVFTTGVLVLQGQSEFVLDFFLRMNQPHQIVSRVVIPFQLMPNMIQAMQENWNNFTKNFPVPPAPPQGPPPAKPPTIEEIYDNLKISDDLLNGVYANQMMMAHTPSEFCLEFITTFYPRAVISARIFMSAPQVPVMINTFLRSWQQLQGKIQPPAGDAPPTPPAPSGN